MLPIKCSYSIVISVIKLGTGSLTFRDKVSINSNYNANEEISQLQAQRFVRSICNQNAVHFIFVMKVIKALCFVTVMDLMPLLRRSFSDIYYSLAFNH